MSDFIGTTNSIVEELLKVIPSTFLMSEVFEKECHNSEFRGRWYFLRTKVSLRDGNMFASCEDKANILLENMCQELNNNSHLALYRFISLVIKSYCEHENVKVDLNGLRIILRSIGVAKITEIEPYDSKSPFTQNVIMEINKWDEIKEAISKLENDCRCSETIMDYQNIGNTCRHLIIKVAQLLFDPKLHYDKTEDGKKIGKTDAVEMLSSYFSYSLKGKHNKNLKDYAQATNDLVNQLTHDTSASRKEMLIAVSATVNLIYIAGTIGDKFNNDSFV
jgi:hypothetical protein